MALSQKHRVALYDHFLPRLGEDVTEALLAEFPAGEGDELATRADLRVGLAELRTEMAAVRAEMHDLSAATNRRITTVVLGATGLLITAGGVMTSMAIAAVG